MAVSKTSLANAALIEIGAETIVSLGEDSEAARLINTRFDGLLDEEVEKEDWVFATERVQLPALSAAPVFGWTYQHELPASPHCLRVLEEVNDEEYMVEGRKILSDASPLQIRYIARITDLARLSALFRTAFIFRLAMALSIPLRGSGTMRDRMEKDYNRAILKAASKDAQQNTSPSELAGGSWLEAKGGL